MVSKPIRQIVTREGLREIVGGAIRVWLWPPLATGAGVVIGRLEQVPWFYVFIGATVIFAAVSSGLLRFSEWRFRQNVKDKLNFQFVRFGKHLTSSGTVDKIYLGFRLINSAIFPIEFEIKSLTTDVMGKFPPKKSYALNTITIPARGYGWFDDHFIEIDDPPVDQSVEGNIEFSVRYGRAGRLNYDLHKKLQVFIGFDKKGDMKGTNWIEAQ